MALVTCRECKAEVSNTAEVCPRCGIRYPSQELHNERRIISIVVAIIWIAAIFFLAPTIMDLIRLL